MKLEVIGGCSVQYYKVCLLSCEPGLLCQLDDACISNPCQKGSNCDTNPVSGNHFCTCPSGYVGASCDKDVDECALGKTLHYLTCKLSLSAQNFWELFICQESFSTITHAFVTVLYKPQNELILSCYYGYFGTHNCAHNRSK